MYSNNPAKLNDVVAEFTGMSDHKIIKVKRFSKTFKDVPRYVKKRTFKQFDKTDFKRRVGEMPELQAISECQNANQAAIFLHDGLSKILDSCAPVRNIQTRTNYAPHLQEDTTQLMLERNAAQQTGATSGSQEDWRVYRGLRNICVSAQRKDRQTWEEKKLSSTDNTPAQLWKSVKGIVGWNRSGPPTRLFENGKFSLRAGSDHE